MARPNELTRASRAYEFVQKVKRDYRADVHEKFNSYVKSAPTMILVNGLAQALAFWNEKSASGSNDAKAYKELLIFLDGIEGNPQAGGLLKKVVVDVSAEQYRLITAKVMADLKWLKRFASAEFKKQSK